MDERAGLLKVFLVEDSALLRERLEAMLASIHGSITVGSASGADDALQAILASGADTVVLDLHLAQGSGMEVLRALSERAPQVQVYILTNYPNDAYRRAAERLGARGFFDKSTEFEQLRAALAARVSESS